jgi:gluconolactonase
MKLKFSALSAFASIAILTGSSCSDPKNVQKQSEASSSKNSSDTTIQPQNSMNNIEPGATLQMISNQFSFTEGPAANKNGDVYFTDQPNNKIWKYSTDGELSVFMHNAGRSNGMHFDKEGNLLTCADEKNELWSISPDGKVTVLLTDHEGRKFNGPNDLWVHPNGHIYFTDPYYQRSYWSRTAPEIEGQHVYRLNRGEKQAIVVDKEHKQPNGIIGSSDGRVLYVADIGDGKTYRYTITEDGGLTDRRLFVEQGSDGMTLDSEGNLYLTGDGVTVYDAQGKKLGQIPVPAKWTANVCFGGKDKNLLFITASESVYTLKMRVRGIN